MAGLWKSDKDKPLALGKVEFRPDMTTGEAAAFLTINAGDGSEYQLIMSDERASEIAHQILAVWNYGHV